MYKQLILVLVNVLFFCTGCPEEMVGAPCVPETDRGEFNIQVSGETWSIETGSVQCATRICLTQVRVNDLATTAVREACKADPTTENCWDRENGPVQLKFSFCSCRCQDQDGNKLSDNPDKYDYLCECPPSTVCQEVMDPIEGGSPKVPGGYCVPSCINTPCSTADDGTPEICTPSKNSEEPWKWFCDPIPEAATEPAE